MKTRACFVTLLAVAAALVSARAEPEIKSTFVEPTAPEATSYRNAGNYAIDRLTMTMITDCANAVTNHEEVKALATFHLKDVPMKNGTVAGLPRITALKLTSLKLRNPENAPDAAEKAALMRILGEIQGGVPSRILVQKVELADGKSEWRVYKPLANIRQCGSCHSSPAEQSPELRAALAEKYPKDESSSYELNEWRGLIRVTVADTPTPAAKAK